MMKIVAPLNRRSVFAALLISAMGIALTGCFDSAKKEEAAPAAPAAQAAAAPVAAPADAAPAQDAGKIDAELTISTVGDNNVFDKQELRAKAGSRVKLIFTNAGKTSNMPHNWVLVKEGTEAAVANEGIQAGEAAGWVREGANVLAHTALIKMGEKGEVVFQVPPAGKYPYICTFPGHYMTMKGTLIAE